MNFDATISFLKDVSISHEIRTINADIIPTLLSALKQDGYSIKNNQPHYLRGLGEDLAEPGSSDYMTSVILVCVCVICAALASGLTQVVVWCAFVISLYDILGVTFLGSYGNDY